MNNQYGVYPGLLNEEGVESVVNGTELELYFLINSLGGFLWRMNHDAADGRFEVTEGIRNDLEEAQYAIEFAVFNTRRFGVEIPDLNLKEGEHVPRTESYNKWYRWWDNYIQNTISYEELRELEALMAKKEDFSRFRPEGDWK